MFCDDYGYCRRRCCDGFRRGYGYGGYGYNGYGRYGRGCGRRCGCGCYGSYSSILPWLFLGALY